MSNSIEQIDLNEEWPLYDDGPVTIDDPMICYKTFNEVSWFRLTEMIERWPTMRKSWEAFIIDYNVCLAQIHSEETHDDIPF
jgi:hypothetical protein